jgi:hypothetical protein
MDQLNGWAEMATMFALLAIFGVFWARIFSRPGYSRWYALALLVPLFNLYVMGKLVMKAGYNLAWTSWC